MYAVIKAGGKQQKVQPGDVVEVEYLHAPDEVVTFRPLLVVDDEGKTHVGKDLQRAVVRAKPLGEQKGDKVRIFKYKSKSGWSRRRGHRQLMTLLEISEVQLRGSATRARSKADEAAATTLSDSAPAG